MRVSTAFVVLATLVASSTALPFGKNSGVTELTSKTINSFLNTHKPVFLMLYAPWCGHCKAMHPDWIKFAKGVKDVVRVGAINADEHREMAQRFGVQGFPTIKYWGVGPKKGKQPQDYQQARKTGALHNAAMREITASNVKTLKSIGMVKEEIEKTEAKKAVILFSSKPKSAPLFSVLSHSPHFKGKVAFQLATVKSGADVVAHFNIDKFPTIAVVSVNGEGVLTAEATYDGPVSYTPIAKFVLKSALGVESPEGQEDEVPADGKASQVKKTGKDAKEKEADEEATRKAKTAAKKPTPVAPIKPLLATEENFKQYCLPDAARVHGTQPFCVLLRAPVLHGASERLFELFTHESLVFLTLAPGKAETTEFVAKLDAELSKLTGDEDDGSGLEFEEGGKRTGSLAKRIPAAPLVAVRAAKSRTKVSMLEPYKEFEVDEVAAKYFLTRLVGGEAEFHKLPPISSDFLASE